MPSPTFHPADTLALSQPHNAPVPVLQQEPGMGARGLKSLLDPDLFDSIRPEASRPVLWDLNQTPKTPQEAHRWALEVTSRVWGAFDTESTGFTQPRPIQVALLASNGVVAQYENCNPGKPIEPDASSVHGKTDADVVSAEPYEVVRERFLEAAQEFQVLVAYNAPYDVGVLELPTQGQDFPVITDAMAAYTTYGGYPKHQKLVLAAEQMGLPKVEGAHDALVDSLVVRNLVAEMAANPPRLGLNEFLAMKTPQGVTFKADFYSLTIPPEAVEKVLECNQLGEKGLKRLEDGYAVKVRITPEMLS